MADRFVLTLVNNRVVKPEDFQVQDSGAVAHSLRKKEEIGVRQPLEKIAIPVTDVALRRGVEPLLGIILEEVNLKGVDFVEGNMVEKCVKPE